VNLGDEIQVREKARKFTVIEALVNTPAISR